MKSQEQINKIEAVVLYILQHFKEGLDYIKLFKIMYFAQREYLATYGLTIAEDTFKARQLGPVPSLTYKVVKMAENGDESADLKGFTSSIIQAIKSSATTLIDKEEEDAKNFR